MRRGYWIIGRLRYTKHMEPLSISLAVVAGVVAGALLAWLLLRNSQAGAVQAAVEREKSSQAGESARLTSELSHTQANLADARRQAETLLGELQQQHSLFDTER